MIDFGNVRLEEVCLVIVLHEELRKKEYSRNVHVLLLLSEKMSVLGLSWPENRLIATIIIVLQNIISL